MNGRAEIGNMSGWDYKGVSILLTSDSRHFNMIATAYMQQQVPSVLFSKASNEYFIGMRYRRRQEKDPLSIITDAFVNIKFSYVSGKEDIITIPLAGYRTVWQTSEMVYRHLQDEVLKGISYVANTVDCVGGMLLDDLVLLPSDSFIVKETPDENTYEKFREKSILYGLEANLPELG